MGQTLSEPVTEKVSDDGQDDRVAFGVSAMQGWRISMEDAHAAVLDLQAETEKEFQAAKPDDRVSFFGVYDGHGGDKVAQFAGEHIHKILAKQEAFKTKDFEQALKDGFLATDRAILSDPNYEEEVSGCTASVGLISKDRIFVANAGDSRSVLGAKGEAIPLSYDHKPQNEGEKARICAAGGFVDFGRVNGNLALSRAIGDFEFKKSADLAPEQQIVTAFPDVLSHSITEDDEFLVIACDGIWDCQSSQDVVRFVRRGIAEKQELSKICENMMDNCLASSSDTGGVGCDNMTMIVIGLLRGKSKDDWYQEIRDRVEKGDGPVAPPEYAEFRGPGVRHQHDDTGEDMEADMHDISRGRIILLGDGTGKLAGEDEEAEDKDIDMHTESDESEPTDDARGEREQTPGPEAHKVPPKTTDQSEEQPSNDAAEAGVNADVKPTVAVTSETGIKAIPETALPEKLIVPDKKADQETD